MLAHKVWRQPKKEEEERKKEKIIYHVRNSQKEDNAVWLFV
jgi:hypothetical protein